jgi:hypothetical protein
MPNFGMPAPPPVVVIPNGEPIISDVGMPPPPIVVIPNSEPLPPTIISPGPPLQHLPASSPSNAGDDGIGNGSKAAVDDTSSQNPPLDQYAAGDSSDTSSTSGVSSDASVGPSTPTTSPTDKLRELEAQGDKLAEDLKNAQAKVDGLMQVFKEEQGLDKDILGKPGSKPGEIDYIPTISGFMSPTVDPLNDAIKARNKVAADINANKAAQSAQRQSIYGNKNSKGFWSWLFGN